MLFLRKIIKPILFIIGGILLLTLITTLFSFVNFISGKFLDVIKLLIPILSTLIGGFLIGRRSLENGWLEGLKLGIIFIVLLVLFDFLGLGYKFKITDFIYYLILIGSTSFGGMLGINTNNNKK